MTKNIAVTCCISHHFVRNNVCLLLQDMLKATPTSVCIYFVEGEWGERLAIYSGVFEYF